jgi:hypothetical protein
VPSAILLPLLAGVLAISVVKVWRHGPDPAGSGLPRRVIE